MKDMTKKIVVCLVLNQLLNAMPDTKERLADILGQDVESLNTQLLPDTLTTTTIVVVWEAISSVINWRILIITAVCIGIVYYLSKRFESNTDLLTDQQLFNVHRKLLLLA